MPGYLSSRFSQTSISPSFICPACDSVFQDPLKCSVCLVVLCNSCFENENQRNCDHVLTKEQNLQNKINNLLLHCKHSQHGCPKILKLAFIEKHEKDDCEYEKLKCDSRECEELSKNGEIIHSNTCGFFLIACEKCNKNMKLQQKKDHDCIDWLKSIVDELQSELILMQNESSVLKINNIELNSKFEAESAILLPLLEKLRKEKDIVAGREEVVSSQLTRELRISDMIIEDKMRAHKKKTDQKLKDFYEKGKKEFEVIARSINSNMKNYLNETNQNLQNLNENIKSENNVLEFVKEDDITLMKQKSPLVRSTVKSNTFSPKKTPVSSPTKKK